MTSELHEALRVRPIAAVLLDAGFQPARGTPIGDTAPDALVWLGEHAGQTLKILAGVDWFGQWTLVGTTQSRREAAWDERRVLEETPQGAVLEMLMQFWRTAFGVAPCPQAFQLGLVYREWKVVRRKLIPGLPHLDADGPMLRAIVNRLKSALARGQLPADATLWMTQIGDQIALQADQQQWLCPARGAWFGFAEVELTAFLRAVPARFRRQTAHLEFDGQCLEISGAYLPGRWVAEVP